MAAPFEVDPSAGLSPCQICHREDWKYTCPQCNIHYCSSACFQSIEHERCSEGFFERCIVDQLRLQTADPETKRRTVEMLQRANEAECLDEANEEEEEDDEEQHLSHRMANVDLDDEREVWSRLTSDEKREFLSQVEGGTLTQLWQPWWMKQVSLVEEFSSPPNLPSDPAVEGSLPKAYSDIPPLSVRFDVVSTLYAYVCLARYYNGEHVHHCQQFTKDLLGACPHLSGSVSYPELSLALASVQHNLQGNEGVLLSEPILLAGYDDVSHMVECPSLVLLLCAFSDMKRQVCKAKKLVSSQGGTLSTPQPNYFQGQRGTKGNQGSSQDKGERVLCVSRQKSSAWSQLFRVNKKMDFYLSWLQTCGGQLKMLLPAVSLDKERALQWKTGETSRAPPPRVPPALISEMA